MTQSSVANMPPLFGHDMTGSQAERLASNPDIGTTFFDQTCNQLFVFDGALWVPQGFLKFVYDPGGHIKSVADSGATGTIDSGIQMPVGAIIFDGLLEVSTAFVGAGASLAIQSQAAGDLLATTAVASLTAGQLDIIPVGSAATAVKVATSAKDIKFVVSGGTFTDGTLIGWLRWLQGK